MSQYFDFTDCRFYLCVYISTDNGFVTKRNDLCSISYELIDGFLSNFVYTSILIKSRSRPLNILFH